MRDYEKGPGPLQFREDNEPRADSVSDDNESESLKIETARKMLSEFEGRIKGDAGAWKKKIDFFQERAYMLREQAGVYDEIASKITSYLDGAYSPNRDAPPNDGELTVNVTNRGFKHK